MAGANDFAMFDSIDYQQGNFSLTPEQIAAYLANMTSSSGDDEDQYKRDLITYYVMGVGGMTVCCFGLIGE